MASAASRSRLAWFHQAQKFRVYGLGLRCLGYRGVLRVWGFRWGFKVQLPNRRARLAKSLTRSPSVVHSLRMHSSGFNDVEEQRLYRTLQNPGRLQESEEKERLLKSRRPQPLTLKTPFRACFVFGGLRGALCLGFRV